MRKQSSLGLLTFLFFAWGFLTCLNDLLVPHLKSSFDLTYTRSILVQFCFFAAYFVVSPFAGKAIEKMGYKLGLVGGLVIMAAGCFMFAPAAWMHSFEVFLVALFILASGIAVLQVAANPYVTLLGPRETASRRLTATQFFNSLGTSIAPIVGSWMIFRTGFSGAESVVTPYMVIAVVLLVIAVIMYLTHLPEVQTESVDKIVGTGKVTDHPQLVLGILGIFFYVGAEVGIGSFLVSLMGTAEMGSIPEMNAAKYVALYWTGAMVGRGLGILYMQKVGPAKTLLLHAAGAVALIALSFILQGDSAIICLLLVGLCNSIMFPTIFSQALDGVGPLASKGSGLLCMAIVGGAVLPLIQGMVADASGVRISYLVPLIGYIYIAYFGIYRMRTVK